MRSIALHLALAAAVSILSPSTVTADCALIPAALKVLTSNDGGVDRPFAAPGDTVAIVSDAACNPSSDFPHFDPVASNNQVTISFLPPTGSPPAPIDVLANSVSDCGTNRCFALQFVMPDTSFTGPARMEVQNLAAQPVGDPLGAPEAVVQDLFEPTRACNEDNRFENLFKAFTVLPPRNLYVADLSASLVATVDGGGAPSFGWGRR